MFKTARGFTFIEVIIVLAIVSTLSILAASFYSRFLTQNAVSTTRNRMVSQLRKAQIYSMTGKQSGGTWAVKYTTTPTSQITLYLQGNSAFDENYSVNSNITISPAFDLTFAHFGAPSGAAFPLTITITGNNTSKSITINSQGVVSNN